MAKKQKNIAIILLISINFFLFSYSSTAQIYYKIPTDTNYYWRQFSGCIANPSWINRYDYQIRYFKDTIINFKTYNKYSTFGRTWGFEYCPSFIKEGFLRQDTIAKKVFILDSYFVEKPLYDFSKVAGDTFLHYNKALNAILTLTVERLDTAYLFNGTKHKAQWVSNNNCFIEGVGSIFGGLYGNDQLIFTTNNITEQLICFGTINPFFALVAGITQIQQYCEFVSATVNIPENEIFNSFDVKAFPNPSNGVLKLTFPKSYEGDCKLKVSNIMGQILYEFKYLRFSGSGLMLDLGLIPKGVYIITFTDEIRTGNTKIIIN